MLVQFCHLFSFKWSALRPNKELCCAQCQSNVLVINPISAKELQLVPFSTSTWLFLFLLEENFNIKKGSVAKITACKRHIFMISFVRKINSSAFLVLFCCKGQNAEVLWDYRDYLWLLNTSHCQNWHPHN